MESRKHHLKPTTRLSRSSELPKDFTRIVHDVYATNFSEGLAALAKSAGATAKKSAKKADGSYSFEVRGAIFIDEIVLAISLVREGQMAATTVHGSVDFDPKASSPTVQDLLNVCVDVVGSIFGTLLDPANPERLEQVGAGSLGGLEDIPIEWTKIEFEGRRVWVMVDKSNPTLDEMTDRWLAENDPTLEDEEAEYEEDTKDLFVTGEKARKGSGSGTMH